MQEKKSIIKIMNISKKFKEKEILKDICFEVYEKEILLLMGKSGEGKSTILKILLGFNEPDSGEIIYNGLYLFKNYTLFKKQVGFVSQENSFYEQLTVKENLFFYGRLYNIGISELNERIHTVLDFVKLYGNIDTPASKLSGGMKRRLEFAISLIHDPTILILDEPFTGLDVELIRELWGLIHRIKDLGVTIILTSHMIKDCQKNADRAVLIKNGKITKEYNLDLLQNPSFDLEKSFLSEVYSK